MRYDKEVVSMLEQFAMPISITRLGTDDESTRSLPYVILQALDPSGVLTIPDLVHQANETLKDPSTLNMFFTVLCLICIVPGLTYYGKGIRAALAGKQVALAVSKFNTIVNLILAGSIEISSYVLDKLPPETKIKVLEYIGLLNNKEAEILQALQQIDK